MYNEPNIALYVFIYVKMWRQFSKSCQDSMTKDFNKFCYIVPYKVDRLLRDHGLLLNIVRFANYLLKNCKFYTLGY